MVRRPLPWFLVPLVASAALMFVLAGCSGGSDGVETVVDAPTAVDSGATTGEGPIAVAASSSEAALWMICERFLCLRVVRRVIKSIWYRGVRTPMTGNP